MVYRLVPGFVEYAILAPKADVGEDGRALNAPYGLCKVEASLLAAGFRRKDVAITPPHKLQAHIDKDTVVVGVHVLDPKGLAPVTWTLKSLVGGGASCTEVEFEKLMVRLRSLKRKYGFKIVVGGPGVWQLRGLEDKYGIDVSFEGEAELTFPFIVEKIMRGEELPRFIKGEPVPPELIPVIKTPSRNGQVQVTRGCPRRCMFCNPTMWKFRSIPLDTVCREVAFNLEHGCRSVNFVTEDVLLYGAKGLELNQDAVEKLFNKVYEIAFKYNVDSIGFSHVSCASALMLKSAVKYISELEGLSSEKPLFPQVGLESGSPRIVAKYFRGKAYPWSPNDWPDVVIKASKIFNDSYWYPCYTYIVGFPDAKPDDYIKTIELIDKLEDEGFKGWVFPLILIPMGGSLLEGKISFQDISSLENEAIECIVRGWRFSLKFSRRISRRILKVKNPLIYKIASRLVEKALDAMETWINGVERNPSIIREVYSRISIRGVGNFAKTMVKIAIPVRRIARR